MPMIPGPKEQSVAIDGQLAYQNSAGASPDAFGASLGQGFQQAAQSADNVAMRDFAIKNETDRVSAENDLMARTQTLQNGDPKSGQVGFGTLEGQNAIDAFPDYKQKVQDAYQDIRSTLNPAVQRMYDQTALRIVRGTQDSMGARAAAQSRVALADTMRARVTFAQANALTYADDPDGWDHHIGEVNDASGQASIAAGRYGDAAEADRRADLGKVYVDRTKQLMLRDPMAAADFYHSNIGMIPANQQYELASALKTTTDAQYARADGTDAYHAAIGQSSSSPMPANLNADFVKPYDQKKIDQVAAYVKAPSPYDDAIATAAKAYNVNPSEIKMKIAMESSGNPKAVSPAGAVGLGQFTADTAARYGVTDRTDPTQSINGIAKMLAATGGSIGGDMSKADRAYYGGNADAKGPNTDQYVENARAARQALNGGGAPAPMTAAQLEGREGAVIQNAQTLAETRRPGDLVFRDQLVASARGQWAQDVQALKGQEYATMSTALDATVKSGAMSMGDLPPDVQQLASKLTPQNLASLNVQFDRNRREANGEYTQSDPKLVNDLRARMYLPDNDPQKITEPGQLTPYIAHGVNYTDTERLRKEITDANNPESNAFLKQVALVKSTARKMLVNQTLNTAKEDFAEEAAFRLSNDLDVKIKAARAAGIDPQTFLTPGSKDYALDPNRVAAFMPTEAQIVEHKAQQTSANWQAGTVQEKVAPSPTWQQLATFSSPSHVRSEADYDALAPGASFVAPDRSLRTKPMDSSPAAQPRSVPQRLPGETISGYLARTAGT